MRRLHHHHRSQEGHDSGFGFNVIRTRSRAWWRASRGPRMRGGGRSRREDGRAVKVVIVKKTDPQKEAVLVHCKSLLHGYKMPRHVEFRDTLPRRRWKVLRRELRDGPTRRRLDLARVFVTAPTRRPQPRERVRSRTAYFPVEQRPATLAHPTSGSRHGTPRRKSATRRSARVKNIVPLSSLYPPPQLSN